MIGSLDQRWRGVRDHKIDPRREVLLSRHQYVNHARRRSNAQSGSVRCVESIEELITDLKDKVTILIVTHNMQQAARVSDYTAYMYLGELIEFDVTDTIFIKPKNKQTEDYITGRFG